MTLGFSKDYWAIDCVRGVGKVERKGLTKRLKRSLGRYKNHFRTKEHAEYWIESKLAGDKRYRVCECFDLVF